MKFVWEKDDIVPGLKYSRAGIKEVWLIGYMSDISTDRRYVSISLSDGMVTPPYTAFELAEELTESRYVPADYLYLSALKGQS